MSRIAREEIEKSILNYNFDVLEVIVPSKYISIVSGVKKENKIYFEKKYNIKMIIKGESN